MRRKIKHIALITSVALFALSSCKNKWKEPVDLSFSFETKQSHTSPNSINTGDIYVHSATVEIASFSLKGERQQGKTDISFSENTLYNFLVEGGLSLDFSILKQLPQGTYNSMVYVFEIGEVTLRGFVKTESNGVVPLSISYPSRKNISVLAKNIANQQEIVLEKGKPRHVSVELSLSEWFSAITPQMWSSVDYQEISGQPQGQPNKEIIINANENAAIYLNLFNMLDNSITVNF
jgi:hypothetical protein